MRNLLVIMGLLLLSKVASAGCSFICPKPKKLIAQITIVHIEAEDSSSGWPKHFLKMTNASGESICLHSRHSDGSGDAINVPCSFVDGLK